MSDFQQHDVTDCGAACLRYVFFRHGLVLPMPVIRQRAGTNRGGTTALGLVETAKECGFEAKGVRCKFEDLKAVTLPGIAHVVTDAGRQHYVVLCSVGKKTVRVMDPALGKIQKWPIDRFRMTWTNVFVILSPSLGFVPSTAKETSWSRLLRLLRPQRSVLAQALVGVVLSTVLSLAGAVYIQKIVDNVIVDGNRNLLRLLGIGMLAILVIRALLGYFHSVLMLRSAQKIDAGLILGYYRHLMRLPQSFFDTMRVGEITSRVRDAVAVRDFLNGTILNLILNPLILIVALAGMFSYSWRLAAFSLALVPAYLAVYLISDWLNRRYQREIMERSADFDAQLVESLHAMSVVRSCGMENEMAFRSETRLVRLLKRVWVATNSGFVIGGVGSWLTQAYSIGLLWIGAELVLDSVLTAGELMSCNALAGYITGPIVAIIGMNASIRTATTATDRLYEILDLEREQDEGKSAPSPQSSFELCIESLDFRYAGRAATLRDIGVSFQSGTITALVGKSGCGKSTILALLQRHYQPERGRILLDGVDLNYIKLSALRAFIAYVPQKIDLLAGTVLENLAPNDAQPDMMRIVELCRKVGVLEFIESLPRGFQTLITENGANLSGGQKQRIAIVRALYADASIVLMDEPSSALDSESEDMLMETLNHMRERGKLVILAVHNRRLLSLCDRVVEMNDGRVISIKSRSELPSAPQKEKVNLGNDRAGGSAGRTVDPDVAAEGRELFEALRSMRFGGPLFGQLDANIMGVAENSRGWFLDEGRCDVLSVTGKWPGLCAFDIATLRQGWAAGYSHLVPKIREAFDRGSIISVGWYPENLITGKDHGAGCGVAELLPGTPGNKELCARLDIIADNLGNLTAKNGDVIPIVFRCWPQANGHQFWWGRSRCTPAEYQQLYRFTVMYLRDVRRVHNFLYATSWWAVDEPFSSLVERYPGDEYVDVLGVDWFGDDTPNSQRVLLESCAEAVQFAEDHGKVAGLTAVGFDRGEQCLGLVHCLNEQWLRTGVIGPVQGHPVASKIRFITFWRNEGYRPSVFHLPPEDSPHAACLRALADESYLVFGDRIKALAESGDQSEAASTCAQR